MTPSTRHPSSMQDPPEAEGHYLVQGYVGDRWRVLRWVDGGFYSSGTVRQRWHTWKNVPEGFHADAAIPAIG